MQVEVITDGVDAADLRSAWNRLLEESPAPSVFLTPEWLLSWWDAYGGDRRMHLLTVRDRGRLVGLVPLSFVGRSLRGWSNEYTDRFGPIIAGQEAVEAAARHLAAEAGAWSRLDLVPLSTGAADTAWLGDALRAVGAGVRAVAWFRSPIVDLPDDPDSLLGGLSGSFQSALRRRRRDAAQAGWTVEIRTDADALDDTLVVAADAWAHREGTGIGSTSANRRFYRALAGEAAARGWLRIALLRDGEGDPIAFELNLVREGAAVNLKLAYREAVADGSPGLVLRAAVIEDLIAAGAVSFDLLGGEEPYKLHWTDRTVVHVRLRAYPPTAAGKTRHLYRHRLRPAVGRVLQPLRRGGRNRG